MRLTISGAASLIAVMFAASFSWSALAQQPPGDKTAAVTPATVKPICANCHARLTMATKRTRCRTPAWRQKNTQRVNTTF